MDGYPEKIQSTDPWIEINLFQCTARAKTHDTRKFIYALKSLSSLHINILQKNSYSEWFFTLRTHICVMAWISLLFYSKRALSKQTLTYMQSYPFYLCQRTIKEQWLWVPLQERDKYHHIVINYVYFYVVSYVYFYALSKTLMSNKYHSCLRERLSSTENT